MAQVTMDDDPWHWGTDRVVAELCSANRSWEPPSGPLKFPPLEELEARLRSEEVDGHTLLTLDHLELCRELNFATLKQKATLKYAINDFRYRSRKYQIYSKRDFPNYESSPHGHGGPALSESNRDADPLVKKPQITLAPSSPHQISGKPQPVTADDSVLERRAAKRRRVAPLLVSNDTDANATGSQPNDGIVDSNWAYLGEDALTRFDIIGGHHSSEKDGQQLEDQVEFVHSRKIPPGRRIQVHRIVKRQLLRTRTNFELRGTRADLVPGANDPDHDELLPLYGDSDEEYDSETWDEIEAEVCEQTLMDGQPALSGDEIRAILDDSIEQFISDWKERKLSKLSHKANKIWRDARNTGLRRSILNARGEHDACEARITRFYKEIVAQPWRDAAEMKEAEAALVLQQSVEDREYHSWVLDVINSPAEPEKSQALSKTPTRRKSAPKLIGLDEEILTSDSEEELHDLLADDFIVDDEPTLPTSSFSDPSPMDIDKDNDIPPVQQQDDKEYHRDVEPTNPDQTNTIDLTQLDEDVDTSYQGTPAKSQEHHVVDLTSPKKLPRKKRGSTSTDNVSKSVTKETQLSTLIMRIDDLEPAEQMVAKELTKLDQSYLNEVFTLVTDTQTESDWLYAMNDALDHQDFPKPPHDAQKRKTVAVYTLLRLFETYKNNLLLSVGRYKKLTYDDMLGKMKTWKDQGGIGKVNNYVDFLCRLSDRFEWKKCPIQADTETSGVKRKQRRKLSRNVDAENLREADRERTAEQIYRRQVLREKLKSLEVSGMADPDTQKYIINESKADNQGFIYVHPEIAQRIKEHQVAGVRFMWNQIVDSVTKQGCLLAHTMGLGKTMQIITLLVAITEAAASEDLSISSQIPERLKESKTLILCPPSLINNWMDELLFWAPEGHKLGGFFKVDQSATEKQRLANIAVWDDRGGILIFGYHLFKSLTSRNEDIAEALRDGPNIVVADEAHEIKNPSSQIHVATGSFKSHSRIALTGSPLANNVEEYHAMINWVAPNYLSDLREFRSEYANPIRQGLKVDASTYERRHAFTMLSVLKQEVAPKVQRITTAVLKHDIPIKKEFILTVPLTALQREAYETFIQFHMDHLRNSASPFASTNALGVLCAHPFVFLMRLKNEKPSSTKNAGQKEEKDTLPKELVSSEIALINKTHDVNDYSLSWKILIVLLILDECKRIKDAVLIFSQSIDTLNYLERIIRSRKFSSVRIDGSIPTDARQSTVKDFNKGQFDVFLISTRAGGIGLNMTAANRVIIFDTKFNPQHEQQAVGRAFRIGQQKPVYVYRLVCGGTLEENLFNIAIGKMQLTSRVVDEKNPIPKAHYFDNSLKMPEEPAQQDINIHMGKDVVLDKVIEQHRSGIRAITMMDSFEEEELEDAALTVEECKKVQFLIAQNEARRSGQPTNSASHVETMNDHQAHNDALTHHEGSLIPPNNGGSHQHHPVPPIHGNATHPMNQQRTDDHFMGFSDANLFMDWLSTQLKSAGGVDGEAQMRCEAIAEAATVRLISLKLSPDLQYQALDTLQHLLEFPPFLYSLGSGILSSKWRAEMSQAETIALEIEWAKVDTEHGWGRFIKLFLSGISSEVGNHHQS
ncbi:hypothetical protein F4781DRAFT_109002 [Annulohypoxylon bovei var. microspora]|nr:hypothetical protein F4781DRAFT_109002 [Annulohypoxylon bovei var. microspora]